MNITLPSTEEVVCDLQYHPGSDGLKKFFPSAFDAVRGQILKLELRQVYREPGKNYDKAIAEGDTKEALRFIPGIIESNRPTYEKLKSRHVEFIRCRPIKIPVTEYTKWEVAVFRETSKHFERIYWCHYHSLDIVFEKFAKHDFMVFDARMAIIQDYDQEGFLSGGWFTDDPARILKLISLFGFIKANCQSIELLRSPKFDVV